MLNPLKEQLDESSIDLLLTGTLDNQVVMIEMDADQISTDNFMECVNQGLLEINKILNGIQELSSKAGKTKNVVS